MHRRHDFGLGVVAKQVTTHHTSQTTIGASHQDAFAFERRTTHVFFWFGFDWNLVVSLALRPQFGFHVANLLPELVGLLLEAFRLLFSAHSENAGLSSKRHGCESMATREYRQHEKPCPHRHGHVFKEARELVEE